jgi:glycosyltransferase involved in cell wall biosynthesis
MMDVYYPYGSDVYKYAHLPQEYKIKSKIVSLFSNGNTRPTLQQMRKGTMAKYLNAAIVNAKYIFADATNEEYKQQIEKLNYTGKFRNVGLPFLYVKEYEQLLYGYVPQSIHSKAIDKLRNETDFIILYHGRQEWETYHNKFTGKNTDHVIRGFAKYILANPAKKACLVMLEYGSDVEASKALITDLNIERYVKWFPKMYRKELMYIVKNADLCCGEFAHSFLIYGTVAEAMLMKKPIVTYRDDNYYSGIYPELYPCFNAREPNEITDAITFASTNNARGTQMGEAANKWLIKYFIEQPLQQLLSVIEQ